jgi:prevent-host-death family protein
MKASTITEAKSGLSALIDRVRAGETVLITDRGVPVARLEPVSTSADPVGRVERLTRAGLMRPGTGVPSEDLLAEPVTHAPRGVSLVDLVIDERRSSW